MRSETEAGTPTGTEPCGEHRPEEGAATPKAACGAPAASEPPRRINNLSLLDGKTFSATTVSGDIAPANASDVGLFHRDTRFLSYLELLVDGHRTVVLSSGTQGNLYAQIELATSTLVRRDGGAPENNLHVRREQVMASHFYERVTAENFNLQPVEITLEWRFDADFADVFQVRGMRIPAQGRQREPTVTADGVVFAYDGQDRIHRRTVLRFDPPPAAPEAHRARFHLRLNPRERRVILLTVTPETEGDPIQAAVGFSPALEDQRRRLAAFCRESTRIESSDDLFDACMETAVNDFFALRIPFAARAHPAMGGTGAEASPRGDTTLGRSREGEIIAAGIPWFATVFGRDSLIAAYQSLLLRPQLAEATLRFLARWQGRTVNDWRDEQPGKILHEFREGELTRGGEVPHAPYYGSVDSTPLFLIVLGETFQWTGDRELLEELLPAARAALGWIEQYGDLDGDGFVEYLRRSPGGLDNQGWKDSHDSNLHRDGRPEPPPIALCEVQGYCYDARYRLSRLLRLLGDAATAERVRREATDLAHRFERAFWLPRQGYYAMSLDGEKRPQEVISSNAGHLLWSRIIGQDRARLVASRLLRAEMFTGWGIRTLAADEPTYNPLSYHRGSVWPHDNSLIGLGLAFYEQKAALVRIFTGLFQAARHFRDTRLPELFVGAQRREFDTPVHYPVSCSPQAWASGAMFLLLTALLGLRPDAGKKELRVVNPVLPEWLDWLRLRNMRIGQSVVSLEFTRRGQRAFCSVLDQQGDRLAISVDFTKRA
ncbi:MAG: amylo-alpha-1,6-glucosidase [Terriglobales bacterium]